MNILCIFAVCLINQVTAMDQLSLALTQEIVRMKLEGKPKLHIQLLQQKLDKIQRQASDKQVTSTSV